MRWLLSSGGGTLFKSTKDRISISAEPLPSSEKGVCCIDESSTKVPSPIYRLYEYAVTQSRSQNFQ